MALSDLCIRSRILNLSCTSVTYLYLFFVFSMQTLAALPDQDSFYDMVDGLEEQGMETVSQRHLGRKGTDLDLVEQLNIYEV